MYGYYILIIFCCVKVLVIVYVLLFNMNFVILLGDSTDDEDDASDNCEFFDAQGGDSFDVTTNNYLVVSCQTPSILQHKSLSNTQVFIVDHVFKKCVLKNVVNTFIGFRKTS